MGFYCCQTQPNRGLVIHKERCSQAMPAKNWLACCEFHPKQADIEYFGARTCEFSQLPAMTQNPGYVTNKRRYLLVQKS